MRLPASFASWVIVRGILIEKRKPGGTLSAQRVEDRRIARQARRARRESMLLRPGQAPAGVADMDAYGTILSAGGSNEDHPETSTHMDASWIVAANTGRARFFALEQPNGRMQEINDMVNMAARQEDAEIETDTLGQRAASSNRNNAGIGPATSSTYQPHQTPKQHEAELFARDVAHYLQKAHDEGRFEHLSLVASPEFLGLLRRELDPQLMKRVDAEINKDYTASSGEELREHIRAYRERH